MVKILMKKNHGFTLVELMVALALGLLITAAGLMLFISGQKNYSIQQGAADIQDSANFGLSYIIKNIQLTNLNAPQQTMNLSATRSGIVFNNTNLPNVADGLVTKNNVGLSNTSTASDQLLIQYLPVSASGTDCEGTNITSTSDYVIERYFLRKDNDFSSGNETANTSLSLVCAASRNTASSSTGTILIRRVDDLKVLLIVRNGDGSLREMKISDYSNTMGDIVGVRLGLLVRSAQAVGANSMVDVGKTYQILDQSVTLNTATKALPTKYLREVVDRTIAIRNALGERQS